MATMSASFASKNVADIVAISSTVVKPAEKNSAIKIPFDSLSMNDFLENIEILSKYIMAQRREKINRKQRRKK